MTQGESVMRKIGILIVLIVMMTAVSTLQAEVKAGSVSVAPFAGYYVFEGNQDLKDLPVLGLRASYNFTQNLGLEGFFSYSQTEISNVPGEPWREK
jgi:OmpA-OmpF porin, OOP family